MKEKFNNFLFSYMEQNDKYKESLRKKLEDIKAKLEKKHNYLELEKDEKLSPSDMKQRIEVSFSDDKFLKAVGGVKGEHIKVIENATNTEISINPLTLTSLEEKNNKKLYITGIPEDCKKAKDILLAVASGHKKVITKLEAAIPRILNTSLYDKVAYYMIPEAYIGFLIGKKGVTIKHIQEESKSRITIAHGAEGGTNNPQRRIAIYGTRESVETTVRLIESKLFEFGYVYKLMEYDPNAPRLMKTLNIPDDLIKYIVGKNGKTFLEIINESETQILINPPKSKVSDIRKVSLFGTEMELGIARLMIDNILLNYAEKQGDDYMKLKVDNLEKYYDPFISQIDIPDPGSNEYPIYMNYYYDYYYEYYLNQGLSLENSHKKSLDALSKLGIVYIPHMRMLKIT